MAAPIPRLPPVTRAARGAEAVTVEVVLELDMVRFLAFGERRRSGDNNQQSPRRPGHRRESDGA